MEIKDYAIYCNEHKELLVWVGAALDGISWLLYWMMSALMTLYIGKKCQGKHGWKRVKGKIRPGKII